MQTVEIIALKDQQQETVLQMEEELEKIRNQSAVQNNTIVQNNRTIGQLQDENRRITEKIKIGEEQLSTAEEQLVEKNKEKEELQK